MEMVRRSPAGLVFKIIFFELLLEIVYLLLSITLVEVRDSIEQSYESARLILSLIFVILAISVVVFLVTNWISEGYYLKKNELILKRGMISKTEVSYPYANMQSVRVNQSLLGRIFNYANISIYIPTLGKDIIFSEISNPNQFADKLKSHIPYPESNQFLIRR